MPSYRSSILRPIVVLAATGCMLAVAGQTRGPAPADPVKDSGQSVTGAFEGWYQNPDGTFSLLAGYFNRNGRETLAIPVGPNNRIEPGGPDQGQPTYFLPRRQWGVFTIRVPKDFGNKKLTWTIVANGQTTSIPMSLNPLWVVEPFKDAGIGNTPPVLRFEPGGAAFQGPPNGIAQNLTAKTAEPIPLVVWVADDGRVPPERGAGRGAASATVSWSEFRGPADAAFDNVRPAADRDGKAATAVRFTMPGEYILRAQSNDATGDGGGGFQCCWTNVYVKVTVRPAAAN